MSRSKSKSQKKQKKEKSRITIKRSSERSSKCVSPSVKKCKSKTTEKVLENIINPARCPNGYEGYCEEGLEDEYEEPEEPNTGEFYFVSSKSNKIFAEDNDVVQLFENSLRDKGQITFSVLDNGAHPFKVLLFKNGDKLNVTVSDNTDKPVGGEIYLRKDKYLGFSKTIENIDQIWIGCGAYDNVYDKSANHYIGNTALIVKDNVCTSIASVIYRFELSLDEHITKYVSTVGNSAVPYGWIQTNKGYYALTSFNCLSGFLPNSEVDESKLDGVFELGCWTKGKYPFKRIQKIKRLKLLIPRA